MSSDSLDESALKKILTSKLNHEDFVLKQFKMVLLHADGMMGEHFRLLCEIEENSTIKSHAFFVKKQAPFEAYGELPSLVFNKEKATFDMFKTINFQQMNDSLPNVYYTDDKHIVFEDLTDEDYVIQTPARVSTDEELCVILDSLAAIHAGCIAYENKHEIKLNEAFPDAVIELYLKSRHELLMKYYGAIIKSLHTGIKVFNLPTVLKSGRKLEDEVERFMDLLNGYVKPSTKFRNSICHCDLWPANIFIKYNKNVAQHAKIIDHQIARYLPPAFDVLDCILLNTSREYRKEHLLRLKKCYFDCFTKYLKEFGVVPSEIYTLDEFLESFKEVEMFAVFMSLATIPLVYNVNRSLGNLVESEAKDDILLDDRSPLITNFLDNEYLMGDRKSVV